MPKEKYQKQIEPASAGFVFGEGNFPLFYLLQIKLRHYPLVKAHHQLDAAVDAAYGKRNFRNDAERVAFLFDLYRKYTSLLPAGGMPAKRASRRKRPA